MQCSAHPSDEGGSFLSQSAMKGAQQAFGGAAGIAAYCWEGSRGRDAPAPLPRFTPTPAPRFAAANIKDAMKRARSGYADAERGCAVAEGPDAGSNPLQSFCHLDMPRILSCVSRLESSMHRPANRDDECLERELLPSPKKMAKDQIRPGACCEAGQSCPVIDGLALIEGAFRISARYQR